MLGLVLLVCTLAVVACGKSSPSSSTSAGIATTSKTAGGGSTTEATGAGSTGAGSSSTGAGGTTGAGGSTGPTRPGGATHVHVRRVTKGSGAASTVPGRIKGSTLRRCLEQNGIKPHASGSKGSTRGQLAAALKRCDPQLVRRTAVRPSPTVRRKLLARPAYRRALARFTACMRQHGLPNFPEANTSGSGPLYPAGVVKPTPQVRAAQRACIGQLAVH